jgi:hypothetical protein
MSVNKRRKGTEIVLKIFDVIKDSDIKAHGLVDLGQGSEEDVENRRVRRRGGRGRG